MQALQFYRTQSINIPCKKEISSRMDIPGSAEQAQKEEGTAPDQTNSAEPRVTPNQGPVHFEYPESMEKIPSL